MNTNGECPIWGTPAKVSDGYDGVNVDSPRAGGKYFCSRRAEKSLGQQNEQVKTKLTDWLVEQRRLGTNCPEVNGYTVEDIEQRRKKPPADRADEILRYLAGRSEKLGSTVTYSDSKHESEQGSPAYKQFLELLAYGRCIDGGELLFLLQYLDHDELIKFKPHASHKPANLHSCLLTVKGHSRLAELNSVQATSSRAFVAMWFNDTMKMAFENGIEPAIKDAGYEPVRIDRKEHNNKIDDEIIAELRKARFVVADFTQGDDGARGGVYYEAGFAHGLGIPVIFSRKKNCMGEIHFDTRQYNHILWDNYDQLRLAIQNRILATVGEGPFRIGD